MSELWGSEVIAPGITKIAATSNFSTFFVRTLAVTQTYTQTIATYTRQHGVEMPYLLHVSLTLRAVSIKIFFCCGEL
jgi:hypothetical protein